MRIDESLEDVRRLFLDSAPVIYYIEENRRYRALTAFVFEGIDQGLFTAVTSPITLAECLVIPYRREQVELRQTFADQVVSGDNTEFVPINQTIATQAAELRSRYSLSLLDALQVASTLAGNCDALLTNNLALKRVTELSIFVLDELEPPSTSIP